jgi:uncharacterized LabA/DUF88 family protein
MQQSHSIFLVDLENFFLSREKNFNRAVTTESYGFSYDLEKLCQFSVSLAGKRRLIVRRAYAPFNVFRTLEAGGKEYYLQHLPPMLMEQGIEPIQVFRYPGGGHKNAADMRLAMDATSLVSTRAGIEQVTLVTGDADFIPLALELRSRGAEVAVIGVKNSTSTVLQRYCDRFEFFEDLVAEQEVEAGTGDDATVVREALRRLLLRHRVLKIAAIKPMLSRELPEPFDPTRFGCEDTGDFLREHKQRLGIGIRQGTDDWEIFLPTPNGVAGPGGELPPIGPPDYFQVLAKGYPAIYVVPYYDWVKITDAVFTTSVGAPGLGRPRVYHADLIRSISDECASVGMTHAEGKVKKVLYQVFKAGCFLAADETAGPEERDFRWSRPARLDSAIVNAPMLREWTLHFVVDILLGRLREIGYPDVDLPRLGELLFGPAPAPEQLHWLNDIVSDIKEGRPAGD